MTPHPSIRRMHKAQAAARRMSIERLEAAIAGAERRFAVAPKGTDRAHHLAVLIWDLRGERFDKARAAAGAPPLSGRPGHPGYDEFCRVAESWGYP